MAKVQLYCDACKKRVDATIADVYEVRTLRGLTIDVHEQWPVCPTCQSRLSAEAFERANTERLYEAYRSIKGIPTGEELRQLREKLGLSQARFAELLGVGVASIQRYEAGTLPTEAHASILKRMSDPVSQREYLDESSIAGSDAALSVSRSIERASTPEQETTAISQRIWRMSQRTPDEYTGFKSFDKQRFIEILVHLANQATGLYRTKLNKVLFYLDFSMYRDYGYGITGLRYAHATYGPVPDKFEMLIDSAVAEGPLELVEHAGGGQVLTATRKKAKLGGLSKRERDQLARVVEFANSFDSATALTEFSHKEDAWKQTPSGAMINYDLAESLEGVARPDVPLHKLLSEREDIVYERRLAQGLAAAFADIEAGRVIVGTDAFLAEMKRRHPDV